MTTAGSRPGGTCLAVIELFTVEQSAALISLSDDMLEGYHGTLEKAEKLDSSAIWLIIKSVLYSSHVGSQQ